MNREIKFRAWDTEKHTWATRTGNGFIKAYKWDTVIELGQEGLVFQQYTGLNDVRKREVYESDICRLWFGDEIGWAYAVVQYHDGLFSFVFKPPVETDYGLQRELWLNIDFQDYEVEVIGNIYENPELLDSKS